MRQPARPAALITLTGGALCTLTDLACAIAGTVNLAAIAAATDQRLGAAPRAQEQPSRRWVGVIGTADPLMTNAVGAAILPRHACPARCGARRRSETRQLGSASCEPLMVRLLRRHRQPPSVSQGDRTDRRSRAVRGWRPMVGATPLPPDAIPGQHPDQPICRRNYAASDSQRQRGLIRRFQGRVNTWFTFGP